MLFCKEKKEQQGMENTNGHRITVSMPDGVADVRLVRAEKMNALDAAMFEACRCT